MGDSLPGLQARLMSQALRKLTASISRSNTMVIFINQIRMKIGVMFGSPETTTGGNALKFYASVRLDIRRIGSVKDRDEVVGNQTRVKVVKNKLAPPFKQVEFDIMYGEGVSKTGELVDLGVKAGVVEKSGAWFSYNSQRLGQGRENAKLFLRDNPDTAREIETALRQNAGLIAEEIPRERRARRFRGRRRSRRDVIGPAAISIEPPALRRRFCFGLRSVSVALMVSLSNHEGAWRFCLGICVRHPGAAQRNPDPARWALVELSDTLDAHFLSTLTF